MAKFDLNSYLSKGNSGAEQTLILLTSENPKRVFTTDQRTLISRSIQAMTDRIVANYQYDKELKKNTPERLKLALNIKDYDEKLLGLLADSFAKDCTLRKYENSINQSILVLVSDYISLFSEDIHEEMATVFVKLWHKVINDTRLLVSGKEMIPDSVGHLSEDELKKFIKEATEALESIRSKRLARETA